MRSRRQIHGLALLSMLAFSATSWPMSGNARSASSPTELERVLGASVADPENNDKNVRLHDTLMTSTIYFEVPNSDSAKFKADGYQFKDGNWRLEATQEPGQSYKSILIFTSIAAAKRMPNSPRYSVGVTGRQLFEFARANGFGVILNANSKPTIAWSPEFVADYLN